MTTLNIRNVEPQIARWFKSEAALRGLTLGQMLALLMLNLPVTAPSAGGEEDGND